MSKQSTRKITADPNTKCNVDLRRPSVFERLGTKPAVTSTAQTTSDYCRNWAVNGNCSYGKNCKYANTHTLISPSKRLKKDNVTSNASLLIEDQFKRLNSKVVKTSHSPDLNLEDWNQTDLEYEDEKVLERRRQLLQRELELQMKKDKEVHGKDKLKYKKKVMSSSSSSPSSSTSSSSSSSSSDDSSSSSTSDSRKKVKKFKKKHSDTDSEDDKGRKRKVKPGSTKSNETIPPKKKRKLEIPQKKETVLSSSSSKSVTKKPPTNLSSTCATTSRSKTPPLMHHSLHLNKERTRSESPKPKSLKDQRDSSKERHYNKKRDSDADKYKSSDDRSKSLRDRRSRTPPLDSRSKHSYTKDIQSPKSKSNRSRTPEKASRSSSKHDTPHLPWHQDKSQSNNRSRDADKRGQDRKPSSRDMDDKNYSSDRNRQRSKERRDKDHRDDRSHSRLGRRDQRDTIRDKDRDDPRDRPRDRDRDVNKLNSNSMDKNPRYNRDKGNLRRNDRDKDGKLLHGNPQRFERYDKDKSGDRFARDRSDDRGLDKPTGSHILDRDSEFERDNRHRRFPMGGNRFDNRGGHIDHDRKNPHMLKINRNRESPRQNMDLDRSFDRGYNRLPPPEHWDEQEEPSGHMDYRGLEDDGRKPMEPRQRYNNNSPFGAGGDRRGRDDRNQRRYNPMPQDRSFDEMHHPIYPGEKMRSGGIRDDGNNDTWDVHHEMDHSGRERPYPPNEWEDREWRGGGGRGRGMWDRDNLPRPGEVRDEEWPPGRYDAPMVDWKVGEQPRKWDNKPMHFKNTYRNDRLNELDLENPVHCKRRTFNTPERREDLPSHVAKQALHNSMKDEPINKKLMELAEGRLRTSREKSADTFQKKIITNKEKPEVKEAPPVAQPPSPKTDPKSRPEEAQTVPVAALQESDLSDISDDPDDILEMEEEIVEKCVVNNKKSVENDKDSVSVKSQELSHPSPKTTAVEEASVFIKEKETSEPFNKSSNMEEETIEAMDFEEISDGELEEDVKTSCKGLGDALGVDWESLVKESQPRRLNNHDKAQDRWQCKAVFQRIGISVKAAGHELVDSLLKKYTENDPNKLLLNNVAFVHTALVRKQFIESPSYKSMCNDELLYRSRCDDDESDEEYEPCTNLYEEAKLLLEQIV